MVIALATGEESVRAYLRDKRFPWGFDFFPFSLFRKARACYGYAAPVSAQRKNGEKIVKSRANLISGDYPGSYGGVHFFHAQRGDSLDPLLATEKNYMRLLCVLFQIHVVLFPCFERSGAFFGKWEWEFLSFEWFYSFLIRQHTDFQHFSHCG